MKIQLVSFTQQGGKLCALLQEELNRLGHCSVGYCKYDIEDIKLLDCNIKDFTENAFNTCEAIIFIGAAGIAVRAIAPFVNSKKVDPAVLVVDETAKYVIPILSGHIGGANTLAQTIASIISAQTIITTATDCSHRFAVDTWAVNNGCYIANVECVKHISAAILNGDSVGLYSDFPIEGDLPEGLILSSNTRVGICIATEKKQYFEHTLQLIPKQYVLGIGCRKNTTYANLVNYVNSILLENGISCWEVEAIASIDLKVEEAALLSLCREWRVPFHTYSAHELSLVPGDFAGSTFVKTTTGVDNVCERAAIKACGGRLIVNKTCSAGITIAIAKKEWRCKF